MSYLETLQQHNTDLQGLIDKANALPEAGSGGGGGSVDTCTVVIFVESSGFASELFVKGATYTTTSEQGLESTALFYESTLAVGEQLILSNVVKGSAVTILANDTDSCQIEGDANHILSYMGSRVIAIGYGSDIINIGLAPGIM